MKEEQFAELVVSVKEGGAILRGKKEPARTYNLDRLDIKRIRPWQCADCEAPFYKKSTIESFDF